MQVVLYRVSMGANRLAFACRVGICIIYKHIVIHILNVYYEYIFFRKCMEIISYIAGHGYNVYTEILEIRLKVDQFVNTNK